MELLNYGMTNIVFNNLSTDDRLRLHQMFYEKKPSQYSVSKSMLEDQNIRGERGLYMRAITTGELEPCVQVMTNLNSANVESHVRLDFAQYDEYQRVDRVKMCEMMSRHSR